MTFSEEVVKKCSYDPELKKIVFYIASLSKEELTNFKKKLNLYFMNKSSSTDIEAYKFYKILIDSNNAKILKRKIEDFLNE